VSRRRYTLNSLNMSSICFSNRCLLSSNRSNYKNNKKESRTQSQSSSVPSNQISGIKYIWVISITPWYSLQTQEVYWEKSHINPQKNTSKDSNPTYTINSSSPKDRSSKTSSTKNPKNSTQREYVMKMSYYIISIMKS